MISLRRLAELASREVRFTARLPERFGRRRIRVSPANHLAILKPGDAKFQDFLIGFVDRFVGPESVVWDIGANMGLFAVPAATKALMTIAFEPDPFNVELLQTSLRMNPGLPLKVIPAAIADKIELAEFAIARRGRSANQLAGIDIGTQTGGARQINLVITLSIDWLLERFPAPTLLKCDAEGAELIILRSATRLLSNARPTVLLEVGHENGPECTHILHSHDYVIHSAYDEISEEGVLEEVGGAWDVIAIPRERLTEYIGR